MRLLTFNKVLALSPHSDDVEFGMGGTIIKHFDTRFTNVLFSTGSVHDPISDEERFIECKQFWKDIPNVTLHFASQSLHSYSEEEWITYLEKTFNIKEFDAIFIPPLLDTHYEHRIVHTIGRALTRVLPTAVIEYKTASSVDEWYSNFYVDIKKELAEKFSRLNSFKSQQKKIYLNELYLNALASHVNSVKKGVVHTEQFNIKTLYC